jgi:hypothetical protein
MVYVPIIGIQRYVPVGWEFHFDLESEDDIPDWEDELRTNLEEGIVY